MEGHSFCEAARSRALWQTLHAQATSPALPCLIAIRRTTASLTEVPRGPQLLCQLRDLPALPCSVADGQAQNVRAVGERRDCQSVHVGPQLRLSGGRDVQLTLPVLFCRPRSLLKEEGPCCA